MKILTVPIISDRVRSEYEFGNNKILEKVYTLVIPEDDSLEIKKVFQEHRLYDLSDIQEGRLYNTYDSVTDVKMVDSELLITLINYVSEIDENEDIDEDYDIAEITELEYPEDTEVFTFTEVSFPEPEISLVDSVIQENEELKKKISQLEMKIKTDTESNRSMILELFTYMSEL